MTVNYVPQGRISSDGSGFDSPWKRLPERLTSSPLPRSGSRLRNSHCHYWPKQTTRTTPRTQEGGGGGRGTNGLMKFTPNTSFPASQMKTNCPLPFFFLSLRSERRERESSSQNDDVTGEETSVVSM
ncbi:hypothetical protein CEXT_582751 [Caerostris extrusa]|uniref:Uncharacterized protein n=1 Tax=Caerostris extrusa TaxID=172846 RepID=A0AAV4YDC8_CAEEX|nr:hypothetical protein CEXT_582751 [Caerostris extrusa]